MTQVALTDEPERSANTVATLMALHLTAKVCRIAENAILSNSPESVPTQKEIDEVVKALRKAEESAIRLVKQLSSESPFHGDELL